MLIPRRQLVMSGVRPGLVLLTVFLPTCGGEVNSLTAAGPTTTLPPRSFISLSVSPNPIVAEPWPTGFGFFLYLTVTITETAGLACNVNLIKLTVTDARTGRQTPTSSYNVSNVIARAGRNFIPANGSLAVPLGLSYGISGGGQRAVATIEAEVIDSKLNTVSASTRVDIIISGGLASGPSSSRIRSGRRGERDGAQWTVPHW